jgi:hypothetical protein
MDDDGKNLLVWKQDELDELNDDPEFYMLWEAEGNNDTLTGLKPDKDYFHKFTNFVAAEPGKLVMDELNKWRQSLGLPLQAEDGKGPSNYGHAYPPKGIVIKGLAYYLDDSYTYPIAVVVKEVSRT